MNTKRIDNFILYRKDFNNIPVFFTDYYEKTFYFQDTFIDNFKKGLNTEYYADILSTAIEKIFYNPDLNELEPERAKKIMKTFTIVPVPASTKSSHIRRYRKLFQLISERTGVVNGFNSIWIKYDKNPNHYDRAHSNLNHFGVNYGNIKMPYRIILIDDIVTSGKSITVVRNKLLNSDEYLKRIRYRKIDGDCRTTILCICFKKTLNKYNSKDEDVLINHSNGIIIKKDNGFSMNLPIRNF